jgi:SAM-dependent methyltransferase
MIGPEEQENLWGYRKRLHFVLDVLADAFPSPSPGSVSVLDLGCGNGSQLSLPLVLRGFQVTGIDPDAASIAHAKGMAGGVANAHFLSAPSEEMAGTQFHAVILSEVLEHVRDPGDLLNTGIKYLRPDGVLIVTTPNGYGEFELDSWLFRMLRLQRVVDSLARNTHIPLAGTDNEDSGHIQFFTRRRLRRIFSQCGLEVWRESGSSFLSGPFVGHSLGRSGRFIEWNARVTDKLPLSLASGWFFALRRKATVGIAQ